MLKKIIGIIFFGFFYVHASATDETKKCMQRIEMRQHENIEFFLSIHSDNLGSIPHSLLTERQLNLLEKFKKNLHITLRKEIDASYCKEDELYDFAPHAQRSKNLMSCVVHNNRRDVEVKEQLTRIKNGAAKLVIDRCRKQ